jgi:hypothetical protein
MLGDIDLIFGMRVYNHKLLTEHYNITEILLKVALNTTNLTLFPEISNLYKVNGKPVLYK